MIDPEYMHCFANPTQVPWDLIRPGTKITALYFNKHQIEGSFIKLINGVAKIEECPHKTWYIVIKDYSQFSMIQVYDNLWANQVAGKLFETTDLI